MIGVTETQPNAPVGTEDSLFEASKEFLTFAIQILLPLTVAILVVVIAVDLWRDH